MKMHPALSIVFFMVLSTVTLMLTHPAYIVIWSVFLLSILLTLPSGGNRGYLMFYLGFTALMIILINPIVSQSGRSVIFMIRSVPLVGRVKITLESLLYGVFMALKLSGISMAFMIFSRTTDSDNMFVFMSKHMPKSTILFSMTVNVFFRIRQDIERVHDVLTMRGLSFSGEKGLPGLLGKVRTSIPLLKIVILSAMEGSLDRAEALQSRGFGSKKRTAYRPVQHSESDRKMYMLTCAVVAVGVFMFAQGATEYMYYPRMGEVFINWPRQVMTLMFFTVIYVLFKKVK
ncbi:energy-coupling factor transporter transmembrane component T [Fusibacter sp. JL216-2]|uniref:energy-coupling factor transporter transmembrane component T n=1 Tax=Fusibacter sp. JL216-2 TaxID=3071453 RepID=UPI003D32B835